MATIYDVDTNELIERVSEELKKIGAVKPPLWAGFVKTGAHKERPPVNKDWWYIRAASVLRKVSVLGPVGVNKLRTKYGGKRNRGVKPERFYRASGNIIRKMLQQLEAAELLKKQDKDIHKGRIITPRGKSLLDKAATQILGVKPKIKREKPKEEKPEKKKPEAVLKAEEKSETKKKETSEAKQEAPPQKEQKKLEKEASAPLLPKKVEEKKVKNDIAGGDKEKKAG